MKTEKFSYKGVEIDFNQTRSGDLMVNATQMGIACGKKVHDFLRLESTQVFMNVLRKMAGLPILDNIADTEDLIHLDESKGGLKSGDSRYLIENKGEDRGVNTPNNGNPRFLGIEKEDDLIVSKQKSGTYMHRVLALRFASWLDARFELFLYAAIDQIFFSEIRLQRDLEYKRQNGRAIKKRIDADILSKHPEYEAYFNADKDIKEANTGIRKSQNRMLKQFELDFNDMQNQSK